METLPVVPALIVERGVGGPGSWLRNRAVVDAHSGKILATYEFWKDQGDLVRFSQSGNFLLQVDGPAINTRRGSESLGQPTRACWVRVHDLRAGKRLFEQKIEGDWATDAWIVEDRHSAIIAGHRLVTPAGGEFRNTWYEFDLTTGEDKTPAQEATLRLIAEAESRTARKLESLRNWTLAGPGVDLSHVVVLPNGTIYRHAPLRRR